MKKSRFLILLLSIPIILLVFSSGKSMHNLEKRKGKIIEKFSPKVDSARIVFWYRSNVKIDRRTQQYKISGTGGVSAGTQDEFEKEIWKGLSKRNIIIGPFQFKEEAVNSRLLYKSKRDNVKKFPTTNPTKVYWFAVTFRESDRLKVYVFEQTPASVRNGSTLNFTNGLYEQLAFKQFAVGPFWGYEQAESAKILYSKNQ